MPTMGDFILKNLKETGPGVKGTESECLGDWLFKKKEEQKTKKPWYSFFSRPYELGSTLGGWLVEKLSRKPKTNAAPVLTSSQMRGAKMRGYSAGDIQEAGFSGSRDIINDATGILNDIGINASPQRVADELKGIGWSLEQIHNMGSSMEGVK